ncbi:MAG: glycoside hydrolase family 25 protein [Lachnospiraceae bacterium]|nr:glycoside hydrolase family 25 protein [Lachnospiraceae bacterium]
MGLLNGQFIDKEKKFTFYDEQSKRWYHTKLKKNVKRHTYDWTKLVHKKNQIKYKDKNFTIRRGIDVYYRNGNIDWKRVKKSGIDFAFIRIGYRGYGQSGSLQIDKCFYKNLENAHRAGIDVGVYFFSQAVNQNEALQEANLVLKTLHGTKLELPVVYDPERIVGVKARTNGVSGKQFTQNTLAFCKKIEQAGYDAMIYSNMYWMAYYFDMKKLEKYPIWYADYRKKPQTPYSFSFWQYSATGRVAGIPTKVDLNVQFIRKNNKPFE